jgi:hypothetical protein
MQMSDFSYLKEMMPGAIDPTEQLDARRADAMEQKDNAKWMGLLQFGAGLSGPGSWSENLSEAGTGLNQVYGERMAAYHQAMQDIEKEALSAQFQNADLASRNVNSGIALGNLEQNQRQALATDERERLGIGLREKEARRRDAIEMSKLEEMAARTAASIKIAEMRTGQRGGMKAKDLSAEARALAEQFVDENAVYETDEERAMAVQKAYIKAYEMLTNMYGLDSGADVTDLGDDY